MMPAPDETLTEALASLGLGHRKARGATQARIIFDKDTGEKVIRGTSKDGWDLVHKLRKDDK